MSMKFRINYCMGIDEPLARFEKAHYDYIATLSGNLEEWEIEARYFKEHCNRKMNFESRTEQWIHSVKVPVVTRDDIEDTTWRRR